MRPYPDYRYRSPFRFLYWLLILFTILLVYVGSIGPIVNFQVKHWLPQPLPEPMAKFYWPVGWLYDNTFLRRPLQIYLAWWADFDAQEFIGERKADLENEKKQSQKLKDAQE